MEWIDPRIDPEAAKAALADIPAALAAIVTPHRIAWSFHSVTRYCDWYPTPELRRQRCDPTRDVSQDRFLGRWKGGPPSWGERGFQGDISIEDHIAVVFVMGRLGLKLHPGILKVQAKCSFNPALDKLTPEQGQKSADELLIAFEAAGYADPLGELAALFVDYDTHIMGERVSYRSDEEGHMLSLRSENICRDGVDYPERAAWMYWYLLRKGVTLICPDKTWSCEHMTSIALELAKAYAAKTHQLALEGADARRIGERHSASEQHGRILLDALLDQHDCWVPDDDMVDDEPEIVAATIVQRDKDILSLLTLPVNISIPWNRLVYSDRDDGRPVLCMMHANYGAEAFRTLFLSGGPDPTERTAMVVLSTALNDVLPPEVHTRIASWQARVSFGGMTESNNMVCSACTGLLTELW